MFILYANKNMLILRKREPMTSGSVNVYEAQFEFSEDWEGLERTAVFKAGSEVRSILLGEDNRCVIPQEVLSTPRVALRAGVYGVRDGVLILPTVWENLGIIQEGVAAGDTSPPPIDHKALTGRDAQDQHPVSAITGLQDILETIPVPMTAEQLRKILMNGGRQNA